MVGHGNADQAAKSVATLSSTSSDLDASLAEAALGVAWVAALAWAVPAAGACLPQAAPVFLPRPPALAPSVPPARPSALLTGRPPLHTFRKAARHNVKSVLAPRPTGRFDADDVDALSVPDAVPIPAAAVVVPPPGPVRPERPATMDVYVPKWQGASPYPLDHR